MVPASVSDLNYWRMMPVLTGALPGVSPDSRPGGVFVLKTNLLHVHCVSRVAGTYI